ncbi:MAG: dihydropteroate synthase [Nitrospirae bacterium]|nr:MAG: dihydropteroate synthase [Nitrospirota bacterium]
MGILNVTPDSFSDGGLYTDPDRALEHALKMVEDGADIIDIGGESTRPGAEAVPLEEELRRTIPVIERLSREVTVPISIDTYKSEVARRAIEAGASIVNDISALRFDPEMVSTVADSKAGLILMHIKGTPRDMQKNPHYDDLFSEIKDYLSESITLAESKGISRNRMVVDPGIGFGKTLEHNLKIIANLGFLRELGLPILIGPSRKSFIGMILDGVPPSERIEGTASSVAISVLNGANIVRVHDVKEMTRVVRVADAIKREINLGYQGELTC